MDTFEKIAKFIEYQYKENGAKWLSGFRYTGMVAGPILAWFGGYRTHKEFEKRKKERNVEDLPLKEKAIIVVKNTVGPVGTTALAIAATAKIEKDKDEKLKATSDALTTALVLGDNKFREFKEAAKETVGEEKAKEIEKKAEEKAIQNAETKGIPIDPVRGIYPTLDTKTGQIFPASKAQIESAFNMVLREVIYDNVFFGQFLEACGGMWYLNNEEACIIGSEYCWPESKTNVYEIGIHLMEDKYGQPMYVITYPEKGGLTAVSEIPWKID